MLDDPLPIDDSFPDEQLATINVSHNTPWYDDCANYIVAKYLPPSFTYQQKKKILSYISFFIQLNHSIGFIKDLYHYLHMLHYHGLVLQEKVSLLLMILK